MSASDDFDLLLVSPYSDALWAAIVPGLASVCRINFGKTGPGNTLEAMANHVLWSAPERFVLVGMCLGAHVGLDIARRMPHRLQGVALINASIVPDSPTQSEMRRQRIEKLRVKSTAQDYPDETYVDYAARWLLSPHSERFETALPVARRLVAEVPVRQSLAQQEALAMRPDGGAIVSETSVPVLCVEGRDDRICPPAQEGRSNVGSHILEACGHLAPVEQPERLASILSSWLNHLRLNGALMKENAACWQ